jgi:Flp pilus assembly protein TadD
MHVAKRVKMATLWQLFTGNWLNIFMSVKHTASWCSRRPLVMQLRTEATTARHRRHGSRCLAMISLCIFALLALRAFATLDEARQLAQDGQVEQALVHVDEALRAEPMNITARLLRGVLLTRAGRSDAAIDEFLSITKDRPDLPESYNNLAVLFAAQGRYDDARGVLRRAIELQPDYDVAHENLGDVYLKLAALAYARAQQFNADSERIALKAAAAERIAEASQQRSRDRASAFAVARSTSTSGDTAEDTSDKFGRQANSAIQVQESTDPTAAVQSPAPPSSPRPASLRCVSMPIIKPAARAQSVVSWLTSHGIHASISESAVRKTSGPGYRVLVPSLGGTKQARKMLAQLRAKGLTDLMVIARGKDATGISLGVYSKRSGAERRQRNLARQGETTQIAEYNTSMPIDSASVQARGPFIAAEFSVQFADIIFEINDCR